MQLRCPLTVPTIELLIICNMMSDDRGLSRNDLLGCNNVLQYCDTLTDEVSFPHVIHLCVKKINLF